jgi:hypothetical protein
MFRWSEYTANADELAYWRQVSDVAAMPVTRYEAARAKHRTPAGRLVLQASAFRPG